MELRLERIVSDDDLGTSGILFCDREFSGFTVEDEFREVKVDGETRIPAGRYEIKLRTVGGMIKTYRARYGDWHTGMIWLQDVSGFEWVYIHAGNTPEHSAGCIIVGWSAEARPCYMPTVGFSRDCYKVLAREIHEAIGAGEKVFIEIVDRDRPDLERSEISN